MMGSCPKTIEAINHRHGRQIVADPGGRQQMLTIPTAITPSGAPNNCRSKDLVCEEWGGTRFSRISSALTKKGVDKLLEFDSCSRPRSWNLRPIPPRPAIGNVIESGLEPGGPTATCWCAKWY